MRFPRSFYGCSIACLWLVVYGWSATSSDAQDVILDEAAQRIDTHRKGDVVLKLTLPNGSAVPANTQVDFELVRHEFLFGCNLFLFDQPLPVPIQNAYRDRFAELMNFATLPFYWQSYEPQQGELRTETRIAMADWCRQQGIATKGHPLLWTLEPEWTADQRSPEQLALRRITREATDFRGLIDYWDVLNEPVVGGTQAKERNATGVERAYRLFGTQPLIATSFALARRAAPDAKLILNDYNMDGRKYDTIIERALEANVSIDAIGVQSHMHSGYWGHRDLWDKCERFGKFGLPVHFTEVTILSGRNKLDSDQENDPVGNQWFSTPEGEQRQAQQVSELYRVLFSHPAVEAITWWDMSDTDAWMGAPSGLLDGQMNPKPAYDALKKLIKTDWHTRGAATTDASGGVAIRGFYGGYRCNATIGGVAMKGEFQLTKQGRGRLRKSEVSVVLSE